jgi:hypothetical protein
MRRSHLASNESTSFQEGRAWERGCQEFQESGNGPHAIRNAGSRSQGSRLETPEIDSKGQSAPIVLYA